ncbi:hypothetical protein [Cereibacter azotoformans]|uniref:hypothetical protein n=1 Tax=Cereibacter azotoformans TaxID=43057 RepID=UPI002E263BA2
MSREASGVAIRPKRRDGRITFQGNHDTSLPGGLHEELPAAVQLGQFVVDLVAAKNVTVAINLSALDRKFHQLPANPALVHSNVHVVSDVHADLHL